MNSRFSHIDIPRSDERLPAPRRSGYPPTSLHSVAEGPRPIQYLQTLRKRKTLLALCLAGGAVLGTLAVWNKPNVYQGIAVLEVKGINENLLNTREVDPTSKIDNLSDNYISTQARIIQSGPLLERVAQRINKEAQVSGEQELTRHELENAVRVRTREGVRTLEIAALSTSPKQAAVIANTVSSEFIQQDLDSRREASRNTSEWLNRELEDLANKLARSEEELQRYTVNTNLLIDSEQGSVAEVRLRQVQSALSEAQTDRIAKQAVFEGAQASNPDSQATLLGDATLQQYQVQLTQLHKDLADLEAVYAPGYYKVQRTKAQIDELEKAFERQRKVAMERVDNDYHAAERREELLQHRYDAQLEQTESQTAKMVRYNALKHEVELNRTIYGGILQKVKDFKVASAMQPSNIRVIDPADIPTSPTGPGKPVFAAASGLGGLILGAIMVLVRSAGDTHIQRPGETQLYLQSPELGVIPSVRTDRRSKELLPAGKRWIPTSEPSLLTESFRSVSASLMLPRRGLRRQRVLVVTSLNPSDGKTTVTGNLAAALAGVVGRVLVIDADRRRARLHTLFDRRNSRGLSELLAADTTETLATLVQDTPIANVFLLPSGTTELQAPDALYSGRMEALVAEARREFDLVLIDTPPVLHVPDARIVGRLSDGVILVLRAGRVRSESAMAVELRLREDGIPVLGTILNDWNPETNGYGVYPDDQRVYSYFSA